jgi:hypothetical protein
MALRSILGVMNTIINCSLSFAVCKGPVGAYVCVRSGLWASGSAHCPVGCDREPCAFPLSTLSGGGVDLCKTV